MNETRENCFEGISKRKNKFSTNFEQKIQHFWVKCTIFLELFRFSALRCQMEYFSSTFTTYLDTLLYNYKSYHEFQLMTFFSNFW